MTNTLTLNRISDTFPWRSDVIYDATRKIFYIYDRRTEKYIVVDSSGENHFPTLEIRNRKETEDWIKNRFKEGNKMYYGDSQSNWIVFKPANITLNENEKLSGCKVTARKIPARKPKTAPKRK